MYFMTSPVFQNWSSFQLLNLVIKFNYAVSASIDLILTELTVSITQKKYYRFLTVIQFALFCPKYLSHINSFVIIFRLFRSSVYVSVCNISPNKDDVSKINEEEYLSLIDEEKDTLRVNRYE